MLQFARCIVLVTACRQLSRWGSANGQVDPRLDLKVHATALCLRAARVVGNERAARSICTPGPPGLDTALRAL
jgi:hypothetical protein